MTTVNIGNSIADYPPASRPLDGTELYPAWQDGKQIRVVGGSGPRGSAGLPGSGGNVVKTRETLALVAVTEGDSYDLSEAGKQGPFIAQQPDADTARILGYPRQTLAVPSSVSGPLILVRDRTGPIIPERDFDITGAPSQVPHEDDGWRYMLQEASVSRRPIELARNRQYGVAQAPRIRARTTINGNGATIVNTTNAATHGYDDDSGLLIGDLHPNNYNPNYSNPATGTGAPPHYPLAPVRKGATVLQFASSAAALAFAGLDHIFIRGSRADYSATNPNYISYFQVDLSVPIAVDANAATVTIADPIMSDIAEPYAFSFDGQNIPSLTGDGVPLYPAVDVVIRDLNIMTTSGAMIGRGGVYRCDVEINNADVREGIWVNSLFNSRFRVNNLRTRLKAIEAAGQCGRYIYEVGNLTYVYDPVLSLRSGVVLPLMRFGECSRKGLIRVDRIFADNYPGANIVSIGKVQELELHLGPIDAMGCTGDVIAVSAADVDPVLGPQPVCEEIDLHLSTIRRSASANRNLWVANSGNATRNVRLHSMTDVSRYDPAVEGVRIDAPNCTIADAVRSRGKLAVNGAGLINGSFAGFFQGGCTAQSKGATINIKSPSINQRRQLRDAASATYSNGAAQSPTSTTNAPISTNPIPIGALQSQDTVFARAELVLAGPDTKTIALCATRPDGTVQVLMTHDFATTDIGAAIVEFRAQAQSGAKLEVTKQVAIGTASIVAVASSNVFDLYGAAASNVLSLVGAGSVGDTVTINGRAISLVASGANNDQVTVGPDAPGTARNLAEYINLISDPLGVTATMAGAVLTLTANAMGAAGNAIATTTTSAAMSFATATLTGGTGATVTFSLRLYVGAATSSFIPNRLRFWAEPADE